MSVCSCSPLLCLYCTIWTNFPLGTIPGGGTTNSWQQFLRIKLPLILPVVGMIAILTFVANFNAFDAVYSMETADGAPNYTTDLIGTLFYRYGVAGQHPVGIPEPGVGAAIATSIFAMLMCGVIPTLKLTQGRE